MARTIHPVGQGAFYSETFRDAESDKHLLTAVYDCGGKKDRVLSEINHFLKVDILFISHFHSDHINGVQELINKTKPKLVVIPRISPSRFLVDFVRNSFKDKSGIATDFMLKILPLLTQGNNHIPNDNHTTYASVLGESKYHVDNGNPIWEYIAFYKEDDILDRKLAKDLASVLPLPEYKPDSYLSPTVYQDIASRLINSKDLTEKIKKVYEDVFDGDHNAYSMLVLSHELNGKNDKRYNFDCLYTGDIKLDDYVLSIVSTNSPDYIQVPHHGSNHNHDNRLYNKERISFISVGETNRYRHPGLKTLLYLYDNCKEIHMVTENRNYFNKIYL